MFSLQKKRLDRKKTVRVDPSPLPNMVQLSVQVEKSLRPSLPLPSPYPYTYENPSYTHDPDPVINSSVLEYSRGKCMCSPLKYLYSPPSTAPLAPAPTLSPAAVATISDGILSLPSPAKPLRTPRYKSRHWGTAAELRFMKTERRNKCRPLLCSLIVVCVLALIVGAIVVIYLTVGDSFGKWFQSAPDLEPSVVIGVFRLTNEEFSDDLKDKNSRRFHDLARAIQTELDSLYSSSNLKKVFHESLVTGFENKESLSVMYRMYFTNMDSLAAETVGLVFLDGLKNRHGHMWLGNFTVDIQSISFTSNIPPPTPGSPTPPVKDISPGWSEWSGWSECPVLECPTNVTTIRTRLCKTNHGKGEAMDQLFPCLIQGGGDMEVGDCDCISPSSESSLPSPHSTPPVTTVGEDLDTAPPTHADTTGQACNSSDYCNKGEVCIALKQEVSPVCRHPKDLHDPTGCGGWCLISKEICRRLGRKAYKCQDDQVCMHDEWQCRNGLCIPMSYRCDSKFDCYDHSDESNCDCKEDEFNCGNRTSCLPMSKRCDGSVDCWNGQDEYNCTTICPQSQFTCNNGQCIERNYFCDGYRDCLDESDEPLGCEDSCNRNEWRCRNGRCVKMSERCNGVDRCGDNSDELSCDLQDLSS